MLVWLLSATIAGFAIQALSGAWLKPEALERLFALSSTGWKSGYFWTLVTYPFLHRHVLHVLALGLATFFVGRELSRELGERRLAGLTIAAVLGGGLSWLATHWGSDFDLMGASTILWCYFTVFACLQPNRELSFLVFFVVPVRLRPRYLVWALLGIAILGSLAGEILARRFPGYDIAHTAHLGAMLVGWIYFRYFHRADGPRFARSADRTERGNKNFLPPEEEVATEPVSVVAAKPDVRAEVDRILDKINSHGFAALTPQEKRVLAEARDTITRR